MKKRQGHLFFSLAGIMTIPILILGVVLIIMGQQSVAEGMTLEIRKALAGTARQSVDLFAVVYPGEIAFENGRFYMGEKDLTGDMALVDRIKENTGTDITLFWGTTRVLTTILDKDGSRIVGTELNNKTIADAVLTGNECYSDKVEIQGTPYYGYYVPVYNGQEVCGMLFAGMSNQSVNENVRTIVTKIFLVFVLALTVVLAMVSFFAKSIVDNLNKIRFYIEGLAGDNIINVGMPDVVLRRNDEIGDMGRHALEVGRRIRVLISNDPLTGLYNRRAGRLELAEYIEEAQRGGDDRICMALGDIDFFKKINDTYGHKCGDYVLTELAELFNRRMDKKGFPVRWGGEEFLLVYRLDKEETLEEVRGLVEELRAKEFAYESYRFHITMTFGISRYGRGDSIDEMVKRADDLLYRGKDEGRDRIMI